MRHWLWRSPSPSRRKKQSLKNQRNREKKPRSFFSAPSPAQLANSGANHGTCAQATHARAVSGTRQVGHGSLDQNEDEISSALKRVLGDPQVPKAIHNYKAALRELEARGITLAGVRDEPMLYSYLINPTYTKHSLHELAIRSFNLNLSDSWPRQRTSPARGFAFYARKFMRPTCNRSTIRSTCRWFRCSRAWKMAGVRSIPRCCRLFLRASKRVRRQGPRDSRQSRGRIQHQFAQAAWRRSLQQAQPAQSR